MTPHTALLRKFHALLARTGAGVAGKDGILAAHGVASSKDLTVAQLAVICDALERQMSAAPAQLDIWRKRVMAAIGAYLRTTGQEQSAARIVGIACRATGYDNFNRIPLERLRNVYYTFRNKNTDWHRIGGLVGEDMEQLTSMN